MGVFFFIVFIASIASKENDTTKPPINSKVILPPAEVVETSTADRYRLAMGSMVFKDGLHAMKFIDLMDTYQTSRAAASPYTYFDELVRTNAAYRTEDELQVIIIDQVSTSSYESLRKVRQVGSKAVGWTFASSLTR